MALLQYAEIASIAWFSAEYAARLIVAPDKKAFIRAPLNVIDLLTILPFYLECVVSQLESGDSASSLGKFKVNADYFIPNFILNAAGKMASVGHRSTCSGARVGKNSGGTDPLGGGETPKNSNFEQIIRVPPYELFGDPGFRGGGRPQRPPPQRRPCSGAKLGLGESTPAKSAQYQKCPFSNRCVACWCSLYENRTEV